MALEIFGICPHKIRQLQKAKEDKDYLIYNFFFFKCPRRLSDSSRITSEMQTSVHLIPDFYLSFYVELKICPFNITLLQNTTKRYNF